MGMTENHDRRIQNGKEGVELTRTQRQRPFHVSCKCDFEQQVSHYLPPCLYVFMHITARRKDSVLSLFPEIRLVTGPGDNCLYLLRHLVCPSFTINFEIKKKKASLQKATVHNVSNNYKRLLHFVLHL